MQALLDAIARIEPGTDARRVFHGRGGLHPGCEHWTLDAFPPVWLLTSFQPVPDDTLAVIGEALAARWSEIAPGETLNWVFQCRGEGQADTVLMAGSVPEPHVVSERGARYLVHVLKGQNHGLFLDMAEGRQWVREHATGHKVLNLFAYTCAFSVVALQGGAKQVVNVDMSAGAMAIGQQNHPLNALKEGASFLVHDIFKTWGKSHQKGSFVATQDYIKLIRRLPDLLRPEGRVLLCLNAPQLSPAFLMDQMQEAAPELVFEERLANPAVFADVSQDRSLKVLVYRAPAVVKTAA